MDEFFFKTLQRESETEQTKLYMALYVQLYITVRTNPLRLYQIYEILQQVPS